MVAFFNESSRFMELWIVGEIEHLLEIDFTGVVNSGSTSATLAVNWLRETEVYVTKFSNGDTRSVTYTNGANTATWAGGLSSNATAIANVTIPTQWYGVNLPLLKQ
jgi:hypothetical protein